MNNKSDNQAFYAGWAQVDITPPQPVYLCGLHRKRVSQYVNDPLYSTVLAIEACENNKPIEQAIIISCDLVGITSELQNELRVMVAAAINDFDVNKLFICATHIHTGPFTQEKWMEKRGGEFYGKLYEDKPEIIGISEYRKFLLERLCKCVVEAWEGRKYGCVSWALGYAVVGHNRRVVYDDGSAQMYGRTDSINFVSLEGPEDHSVNLIYLWDEKDEMTGVLVNIACPSQCFELESFISADFWGEVRKEMNRRYKREIFVLPLCGAAGDQHPIDLIQRGRGQSNVRDNTGIHEIAQKIVNAIELKLDEAQKKRKYEVFFKHVVKSIELPVRRVTKQEADKAKREFEEVMRRHKQQEEFSNEEIKELYFLSATKNRYNIQQKELFYEMEMHVLRLGEAVIVTNAFELFLEYGLQIKARSIAELTFIVQLACDFQAYLPTEKAIHGGHYSTGVASSKVGPEGGRLLVNHTVKAIDEIFNDL